MFKFNGFLAILVGIISAVLVAGAYPMVGRLLPPRKNARRAVVETASGAKVRLHPHSSNFNLSFNKSSGNPLMVFDEITRGDGGMYVKNCSVVGSICPQPLLWRLRPTRTKQSHWLRNTFLQIHMFRTLLCLVGS